SQPKKCQPQTVKRLDIVRLKHERLSSAVDCLTESTLFDQGSGQVTENLSGSRAERRGSLQANDRLFQSARLTEREAQVVQRQDVIGLLFQCLFKTRDRLRDIALDEQRTSEIIKQQDRARLQSQAALITNDRLGQMSLLLQGIAEPVVALGGMCFR